MLGAKRAIKFKKKTNVHSHKTTIALKKQQKIIKVVWIISILTL